MFCEMRRFAPICRPRLLTPPDKGRCMNGTVAHLIKPRSFLLRLGSVHTHSPSRTRVMGAPVVGACTKDSVRGEGQMGAGPGLTVADTQCGAHTILIISQC